MVWVEFDRHDVSDGSSARTREQIDIGCVDELRGLDAERGHQRMRFLYTRASSSLSASTTSSSR